MLHGRVLRAPAQGATLRTADVGAAAAVPGVTVVRDGSFVGVIAADPFTAGAGPRGDRGGVGPLAAAVGGRARRLAPRSPGTGRRGLERALPPRGRRCRCRSRRRADHARRDVHDGLHRPRPPRDARRRWRSGRTRVGSRSGPGRRSRSACGRSSRRLSSVPEARGARHRPGHRRWVRRQARRHRGRGGGPPGPGLRPPGEGALEPRRGVHRGAPSARRPSSTCAAGRAPATITAWEMRNTNSGMFGLVGPYEIPNQRLDYQPADSPLPQGSYRALAATANHFARESHLDELASALGVDPLELRLAHLRDDRLAAVLRVAARAHRLGAPAAARPGGRHRRGRREGRPGRDGRRGARRRRPTTRDPACRDRVRVRPDRQPGRPCQPGRGRPRDGARGGPLRGHPVRGGHDPQRVARRLPCPALRRRAADRCRAAGPAATSRRPGPARRRSSPSPPRSPMPSSRRPACGCAGCRSSRTGWSPPESSRRRRVAVPGDRCRRRQASATDEGTRAVSFRCDAAPSATDLVLTIHRGHTATQQDHHGRTRHPADPDPGRVHRLGRQRPARAAAAPSTGCSRAAGLTDGADRWTAPRRDGARRDRRRRRSRSRLGRARPAPRLAPRAGRPRRRAASRSSRATTRPRSWAVSVATRRSSGR